MIETAPKPFQISTDRYLIELCPLRAVDVHLNSGLPFLHESEAAFARELKIPKRRRDWLGGRLAAKRLLRRRLRREGIELELSQIQIWNHPSGEPYAAVPFFMSGPWRHLISISHCEGLAAAVLTEPGSRIGIDVETVAPRRPSWLDLVAYETERSTELDANPLLQTTLWSLKEAVMKLLGIGATVDFQDIRFRAPEPSIAGFNAAVPELRGKAHETWERLGRPLISHETHVLGENQVVLSVAHASLGRTIHGD